MKRSENARHRAVSFATGQKSSREFSLVVSAPGVARTRETTRLESEIPRAKTTREDAAQSRTETKANSVSMREEENPAVAPPRQIHPPLTRPSRNKRPGGRSSNESSGFPDSHYLENLPPHNYAR